MPSTEPERRDALPVGTVLRDFTIRAVIGHGGFGIVYRAGHNELNLTVAIKEYLPVELAVREGPTVQPRSGRDRKDFDEGLRRFRAEAQALIDFDSHPSILSCRDFFRAHGTAYLVMDYEDGQSLAELLAKREGEGRPFTESDLLAVMTPLLEGLARVHAAGVLHRDIKPSNILIRGRDERPVLIDFGAAKQATARFSKSQAPYTEGYAALEQVADTGKLGPWTDIYGAGAVMWRMVAGGNRPWEPPHPVRVELRSHAALGETEDPMPSAGTLGNGRFPPRMLESIDQCLRLRETERIQDSQELLEVLRFASAQSPAAGSAKEARPRARRTVASRQARRSRAAQAVPGPRASRRRAVWLGLAGSAVGLGLVLSIWPDRRSEETTAEQRPDRVSSGFGGEDTTPERDEPLEPAERPSQTPASREPPQEATGTDQPREPDGISPGHDDGPAATDRRPNSDGGLEVRPEPSPPASREPPPEAIDTVQLPDPIGMGTGHDETPPDAANGQDTDVVVEVRPEQTPSRFVQPWVRDWEALGNVHVQNPGFAVRVLAFIAMYRKLPEASQWVARAEALLEEQRKLEEAGYRLREAGDSWTNSLGMEFAWIPAGSFLMGSPKGEKDRSRDERQHMVRISEGFWMKTYEVTQGEWVTVMGENPSNFKKCGWRCPVEKVSWNDAQEYIRRLNGRESGNGYLYRLPTEAEWEYAARAGTTGPRYGELKQVAWRMTWGSNDRPHPVALKRANRWGLHDMLGNVWEWTADWYGQYPTGPVTDPSGPSTGSDRVRRGGSWSNFGGRVRSAFRGHHAPTGRSGAIGFRLVRTK